MVANMVKSQTSYNKIGVIKTILILTYHNVGVDNNMPYSTDVNLFEQEMKMIMGKSRIQRKKSNVILTIQGGSLHLLYYVIELKNLHNDIPQPLLRIHYHQNQFPWDGS
jgi:hypothetical protein